MSSPRLSVLVLFLLLLPGLSGWAQQIRVTGKVISEEDGKPLSNVNIVIKGKTSGTQTDANGQFSLEALSHDILIFSYAGLSTLEVMASQAAANPVALKADGSKLGEVVVVGYGTQSRKNVTSSISKLDKEVLANAPRANIGSALQGTVAGLRVTNTTGSPGAAPSILLRGGASINSPNPPLVVVDGVIRSYNDIPSDDIASIELLKDAASTAIYGARANNGVILITTKQGKAGTAQVAYKYIRGYNRNREGYQYLNARDYIYYNRLGNLNSQRTLAQVNSSRGYGLLTDAANLALFDIRSYNASTAGLLQNGWDTVSDPYGGVIIFKDHGGEIEDLVFRNTSTNDHYVNVTGGNDRGKYFASFNYYNEDGVIVGSSYKRYSANLNGSYKIKPNVEVTTGATFSTATTYGALAGDVSTIYRNLTLWPTMNPWLDSAKTKGNPGNGISDGNPLYWLEKVQRANSVNRITANASLKYDILPGLFVKASANAYLYENTDESFTRATQTYSQIFSNPQAFNTTRPAYWYNNRIFQQQYNGIINYNKHIGSHNITAMLGAEYFGQRTVAAQVSGTNAPTDDIPTVNASTTFAAGSNYSSKSEYRIISHFGRINYDFDQRYLLTLTYRQDGISSLAKDNRWGFFPGMSAGWNVHNEAFFEKSGLGKYISTLKPRISYGVNGNIAGIGDYEVQGTYGALGNYNNALGFLNTGIPNSGLKWEKSTTTDIGVDIGLLNDRLSLIVDYYNRETSDLLTNLTLPGYTGFGSVRTNLGTFRNTGYELTINATIIKNPNGFNLSAGANVSYVKNKIIQLPYNGNDNNRQGGLQIYDPKQGKVIWVGGLQEGQALGDIYGFKQLSIFQSDAEIAKEAGNRYDAIAGIGGPNRAGVANKIAAGDVNWMDVDRNDTIDSRDQVYLGNVNPKYTGGFSLSASYKGLSLYTRFEFAIGHTIYNDLVARTLGNYQGTFNYIDWQKKGFSGDNSMSDIPKVYYADQVGAPAGKKNYTRANNANGVLNGNNSRFYEKGDYLACREITLSYEFTKTLLSKTKFFSQGRIYAGLNNLFYITKFSGPSPEPPVSGGVITGIYAGTYPVPRSYTLGVQVTF
jgi:TonB-linked SusC/RagA family outer membrane protein